MMNKVTRISFWIFRRAFEVSECCILSPHPRRKLRLCARVDIFMTALFLDLKVCVFRLEEKLVARSEAPHQRYAWNMGLFFPFN